MELCNNCEMAEYCNEIGRCFRKPIETDTIEGTLTPIEDVEEPELKRIKYKTPGRLTKVDRDFLKDIINF